MKGSNFITNTSDPWNWLSTPDDTRWNGATKGTHDPCPDGFRVPTQVEWEAERNNGGSGYWGTGSEQNNATGAYNSQLKLTMAGYRTRSDGTVYSDVYGQYWSSTVSGSHARALYFTSSTAYMNSYYRADGYSVRCIQED